MKRNQKGVSGRLVVRRVLAVFLFVSLLLLPAVSPAVSLTGDSSTYVQSRETADSKRILGAYEYLDLDVQNIGDETITFHTGGWLRYDLKDEEFGKRSNSDLQYAYLSFKSKRDNTIVNLGRVMVFEGVAAERVDGLYARTDLKAGFGVSAFGGSPVETGINLPENAYIYGGRLSHQIPDLYRIGVSYLKEEKDNANFREEEGVDLWVHPMNKVELSGRSSYNSLTKGWMEHAYYLTLGPFEKLRLTTEATRVSYKDYFSASTSAVFRLQAGILDPNEKVTTVGEEVSYPLTDHLLVSADYKNYEYEIAGHAGYYGGKIRYSTEAGGAGGSVHRMDGDTDRLRYSEYRVYGYKKFGKADVTVDLLQVSYDSPINGRKDNYSASLAAVYDLTEAWKVGADVEYAHDSDFDNDVRALVKLLYHFGSAKGGV